VDVSVAAAEVAMRAEIAYYVANHLRGRDRATLSALRDECARVVAEALGVAALPIAIVRDALLQALVFTPYSDVVSALIELRARGSRLVVVSNWDCSLTDTLERAGLSDFLDGAVSSAQVGAAKPDPRPFRAALALARCEPKDAVMVGNSIDCDVEGARGVGIRPVLLARGAPAPDARSPTAGDVAVIEALDELASLI
jgi:putative hydrolase of the HAD superfamily